MFIIRIGNRIFFISDYWILFPLLISIEIGIILYIKRKKAKRKKLEKQNLKQLKIFYLATSNYVNALGIQGGDQEQLIVTGHVDVTHSDCSITEGVGYLENQYLKDIIIRFYGRKTINGIIYITKTALCQLASVYGASIFGINLPARLSLLSLPIVQYLGWATLGHRIIATALIGCPLPVVAALVYFQKVKEIRRIIFSVIIGLTTTGLGFVLMYSKAAQPNLNFIAGTFICQYLTELNIPQRILGQEEVVYLDLPCPKETSIQIGSNYECSLPDQMIGNPKCNFKFRLGQEVSADPDISSINYNYNYNEVVNMEDVTNLPGVNFNDRCPSLPDEKS